MAQATDRSVRFAIYRLNVVFVEFGHQQILALELLRSLRPLGLEQIRVEFQITGHAIVGDRQRLSRLHVHNLLPYRHHAAGGTHDQPGWRGNL